MRRLIAAVLLSALVGATLGCSSDDDKGGEEGSEADAGTEPRSEYCQRLGELNSQPAVPTSPADVDETLRLVERAADEAPDEVADAWAEFRPALEEGLGSLPDQLVDPEDPPEGTSREDAVAQNYATTADALNSLDGVSGQVQQIRKHARTDCRIGFQY